MSRIEEYRQYMPDLVDLAETLRGHEKLGFAQAAIYNRDTKQIICVTLRTVDALLVCRIHEKMKEVANHV